MAAVAAGIAGLLVAAASMAPGWQWFGPAEVRASSAGARVALTFDDGPEAASTERLLEALAAGGHRATFFLLADRASARPDLARRIAREGHEIGLHGASHHPWLTVRSVEAGAAELRRASEVLEQLTGARPVRFRPPFGAVSPRLCGAAAAAGLVLCWCSVRTYDGGRPNPDAVRARAGRAAAGDIVLLHDRPRPTADVLPAVLGDLERRGLRSVTVAELMGGP